jgi:dipeptidyl aminopeptidase/acylaminoacyl peptidase
MRDPTVYVSSLTVHFEVLMPRTVLPGDLFDLKFFHSVAVSPGGSLIVYALSEYDEENDADFSNLWLLNIESEETRQLTYGVHNNTSPAWSPDGKRVTFVSDRGEKPQIFVLSLDGGESRQVTDLAQGVGGTLAWSPDGRRVTFGAAKQPQAPMEGKPYRVRRPVYRFDAMGYLDVLVHDLYAVDMESGSVVQLTDDDNHNGNPAWSPDGNSLLFTITMPVDAYRSPSPELAVLDVSALDAETDIKPPHVIVSADWGEASEMAAWLPEGQEIAFVGQRAGKPIGSKLDLFVVDINGGGSPQNRTPNFPVGIGGRMQPDMPCNAFLGPGRVLIDLSGDNAYVRVQIGGTIQIWRVALSGKERYEVVIDGERSVLPVALAENGKQLITLVSDMDNPVDLWVKNVENGDERCLTDVNAAKRAQLPAMRVEPMRFPSIDGVEVEGWMMLPLAADCPAPTVLYIHGGPHSAFGHLFHFDTRMLVGAGFGVLMINHRASTGYGDEFSTAIKGDWGNLDYADLMAGVDVAIERGWADADRLGVCGLSGGGNLSSWIVGQTDRFKAAVPENPVTNWQSFYGTSDIGVWFSLEQLGGHPHEIPDVYANCSPITFAYRCTTPTLMIQSESDYRCPAEQSEQFYTVLKANGCTVEMLRLPGGSHASSINGQPAVRRAQNEALLDWMERFV